MQYARLTISFLFALCVFVLPQSVSATAYYIDFNAAGGGNGLATTTAFNSLDAFTESARSAGDIAFVRRGAASTTNVSDLTFTSSGSITSPIVITADYDNIWSDFATSSQTYTIALATSTFYADASITGVAAGDWIYVEGDCGEVAAGTLSTTLNSCEFAYEVSSVSGTALSLYLPYKGNQTGSGKSLRVMPDAPQWNATTGDFQWVCNSDSYWFIKGIDIRGTDSVGIVNYANCVNWAFLDVIIQGNSTTVDGMTTSNLTSADETYVFKSRLNGFSDAAFKHVSGSPYWTLNLRDVLMFSSVDCIDASQQALIVKATDVYFLGCTSNAIAEEAALSRWAIIYGRNVNIASSITTPFSITSNSSYFYMEDYRGQIGLNTYAGFTSSDNYPNSLLSSTSTVVRSGGGAKSIRVEPTTSNGGTSINTYASVKLFEYPIHADTSSKQYDVYFMSTSTAGWTANPTATQLLLECEYWSHQTGATTTRAIKKSTGTVNFTGSTAWQSLSVTCQPTQTGILYLRGWYAKTKETGKMNEFYVDGTPVIQ